MFEIPDHSVRDFFCFKIGKLRGSFYPLKKVLLHINSIIRP